MEVFIVEQHLYLKIAILHGKSGWECHAEICEALGDHALTEWVQTFRSRRVSMFHIHSLCHNKMIKT